MVRRPCSGAGQCAGEHLGGACGSVRTRSPWPASGRSGWRPPSRRRCPSPPGFRPDESGRIVGHRSRARGSGGRFPAWGCQPPAGSLGGVDASDGMSCVAVGGSVVSRSPSATDSCSSTRSSRVVRSVTVLDLQPGCSSPGSELAVPPVRNSTVPALVCRSPGWWRGGRR